MDRNGRNFTVENSISSGKLRIKTLKNMRSLVESQKEAKDYSKKKTDQSPEFY